MGFASTLPEGRYKVQWSVVSAMATG